MSEREDEIAETSDFKLEVKAYRDLADPNLPEEEGKFVLMSKGHHLHLVLSPLILTPYHANIVFQYLQVEGRGRVEAVTSSGCRILTKGWQVHGGGFYKLERWLHALILEGKSTAFGKYQASLLHPFVDEIPILLGLSDYFLELK